MGAIDSHQIMMIYSVCGCIRCALQRAGVEHLHFSRLDFCVVNIYIHCNVWWEKYGEFCSKFVIQWFFNSFYHAIRIVLYTIPTRYMPISIINVHCTENLSMLYLQLTHYGDKQTKLLMKQAKGTVGNIFISEN